MFLEQWVLVYFRGQYFKNEYSHIDAVYSPHLLRIAELKIGDVKKWRAICKKSRGIPEHLQQLPKVCTAFRRSILAQSSSLVDRDLAQS